MKLRSACLIVSLFPCPPLCCIRSRRFYSQPCMFTLLQVMSRSYSPALCSGLTSGKGLVRWRQRMCSPLSRLGDLLYAEHPVWWEAHFEH
jgi:hypothetical protein